MRHARFLLPDRSRCGPVNDSLGCTSPLSVYKDFVPPLRRFPKLVWCIAATRSLEPSGCIGFIVCCPNILSLGSHLKILGPTPRDPYVAFNESTQRLGRRSPTESLVPPDPSETSQVSCWRSQSFTFHACGPKCTP